LVTAAKSIREDRRLTQEDVIKATGLSLKTVSNFENGNPAHGTTIEKLADFYGVTTDELLGRKS